VLDLDESGGDHSGCTLALAQIPCWRRRSWIGRVACRTSHPAERAPLPKSSASSFVVANQRR
jgi:hypothetical protein